MRYVVVEQDSRGKILGVTGPFANYELAIGYAQYMYERYQLPYTVSELSPTKLMRMS